ncbi:E3 ubiquitin-protein ligase MIB2 [Magallana gigas]|uniref:E3 ubiquitin-protein ligase MIB2 n=1 Tax=Magallana gigas TaxID=29159 RepID=UPI0033413C8A
MSSIKPGTRVVRGPDWASKKQDNGEGFLGTIIFVPKAGSSDNQVTVIWDSGRELRYRAGHNGKYDLRVYDCAPAGIVHDGVTCNECKDSPLKGIRWKCSNCSGVNLCSLCYMSDKHDVNHGFERVDTSTSPVLPVPPRSKSKSIPAKGLFPGAEVIRGPHWKWKNDDGGEGDMGMIKDVVTWDKKYHRGGVSVVWKSDNTPKTYRVGGEGCVDVIYTRVKGTASGRVYYPDHLPVVDVVNPGQILFKPGDKVRVNLALDNFKRLQEDNADGWKDSMKECIGELGTIVQMLFQGKSCRVQYMNGKIENINRAALTRVHTFTQGEAVTILSDSTKVKELQDGHGGWNDDMKTALGKNGRIVRIDQDGDIRIKVEDKTWIFSPVCINPMDNQAVAKEIPAIPPAECVDSDVYSDVADTQSNDVAEAIAQLYVDMLRGMPGHSEGAVSIVQAAGQGDLQAVKDWVKNNPDKIDKKIEGKTALQIACYEGYVDIVRFLLQNKANPDLKDSEEDSPLHYSAFGVEHNTMVELLKAGANANIVNKGKQTPLHIAVGKKSPECVKVLMKFNADPSVKDSDEDTPMHDAITQQCSFEIIEAVLGSPKARHEENNSKGFNVLQWAVMKDAGPAVNVIIEKNRSMVNEQMSEGFTALHIAAANDHVEIASVLISRGQCNVNATDKDKRTPLIICVSQGHTRIMEVLIAASCNVNAQDNSGNTALHVAQMNKSLPGLIQMKPEDKNVGTKIICALLDAKADLYIKNKEGRTPLDLMEDETSKHFMIMLAEKAKVSNFQTTRKGVKVPSDWVPMNPRESYKLVVLSSDGGNGMMEKEYQMVAEKFRMTLGQAKILQIERVQNPYYWECYQLKKLRLEQQYGGSGCSNEKELFHGTVPTYVEVICKDNLDFRLAGERVGTLFGKGTYFAIDAKYSDLYSQVDKEKNKFMFLVKVLCGKCAPGDTKYARPPPVDPKNPTSELYDCCVDNVDNPRVFCVFDKNQYYPQYLIKYK